MLFAATVVVIRRQLWNLTRDSRIRDAAPEEPLARNPPAAISRATLIVMCSHLASRSQ
jgi:hypothetical protein